MLTDLRIENFAIIQQLELHFQPGLTTFTGETGAGKSIILDALMALLGGKADATLIRAGADRANVEGEFSIPPDSQEAVRALLAAEDLLEDPNSLSLAREMRLNGRSVARINGHSASVTLLRDLGQYLVDIHGQSEHLSLLNVRQHLQLLDRFASVQEPLEAYRRTYQDLRRLQKDLKALRQAEKDAASRSDLLGFQAGEIEAAHLATDEEEELRSERTRLANAEGLNSLCQQTLALLDEGAPDTPALTDLAGQMVQALDSLVRLDPGQKALAEQAQAMSESLDDISRELRSYMDGIEFNPRRLEQVEERLDLINRLKRKYGGTIEAVLEFARKARADLDNIAHATERIAELEQQEIRLRHELSARAAQLSGLRGQAARALSSAVEKELDDLSMSGAQFEVDIHRLPDAHGLKVMDSEPVAFDDTGIDKIEFLIAPNPGEGLKPLVKIASGGETSRLMLALKRVLTRADSIPTLVFDEIDQGIGGRVGSVVGEKLWQLGRNHQVLCVTHLPQLAAFGDQQYSVRKEVDGGRTTTHVEVLAGEARQVELAQMLGAVTDANLHSARETLATAQQRIEELGR
jgi:DNA repair protein RecN (Recombination protein N)